VGGESTRPGAQAISVDEELRRVIPVIEAAAKVLTIPISIDTTKPEVMKAAISAGAGFINDVMALRAPGALRAAAECGVPVCLMHMQGKPNTMQNSPEYADVPDEVKSFLLGRLRQCLDAGIPRDFIMLDPGIGFGKKLQHNLQLLRNLDSLLALGQPIMVGASRKSMIGALLGDRPVADRVSGSVAAALFAATRGAKLIRAHDVGATADALRIWQSLGTSAYKD
jgi:dihydropteroate synthase